MAISKRDAVIDQLELMASEDYQKNEWINNLDMTWFFPDEIIAIWFDDLEIKNIDTWDKQQSFTSEEIEVIKLVSSALSRFYNEYEKSSNVIDANLLQFKPWRDVVEVSKKALKIMNSQR